MSASRPRAALPQERRRGQRQQPGDHFDHAAVHPRDRAVSGHRAGPQRHPAYGGCLRCCSTWGRQEGTHDSSCHCSIPPRWTATGWRGTTSEAGPSRGRSSRACPWSCGWRAWRCFKAESTSQQATTSSPQVKKKQKKWLSAACFWVCARGWKEWKLLAETQTFTTAAGKKNRVKPMAANKSSRVRKFFATSNELEADFRNNSYMVSEIIDTIIWRSQTDILCHIFKSPMRLVYLH